MKSKLLPILATSAALTFVFPTSAFAGNQAKKANLTEAQKTQLEQVKNNARSEIEAVLTAEQQTELQNALDNGQKMKAAVRNLNLSSEQQSQLDRIMQSAKQQKRAIYNSQN